MKKRIGIDIDGVLADFSNPYVEKMNEIQGSQIIVTPEMKDCWHFETKVGFTVDTREEFWRWAKTPEAQEWWENLPLLCTQDEQQTIVQLAQQHDVVFITKCPLHMRRYRQVWADKHFFASTNGHFFSASIPVVATNRKGPIAYGLELHAMIDDKPQNLVDVLKYCGTSTDCYLVNQTWNQECNHRYIERVANLQISLDKINKKVYNV